MLVIFARHSYIKYTMNATAAGVRASAPVRLVSTENQLKIVDVSLCV